MNKEPSIFLMHILDTINLILNSFQVISKEEFKKNDLLRDATIRRIEVIGEAVKNLPMDFREKYNNLPWKEIAGMRDKLMHHYFGVDLEKVWKTVKDDIPLLKEQVEDILKQERKVKKKNK